MEDETLRNEDDLIPVETADDEDSDTTTSVEDDTLDGDDDQKAVPYERFKEINDEKNDLKEKYEALKSAKSEPKDEKKDDVKKDFDKSRFSEDQIETIKNLAGVPELQKELKEYREQIEVRERKERMKEDTQELSSVLKDEKVNPHSFKPEDVRKQVIKWADSDDVDKQWLARANYKYVLREMNEIQEETESRKKNAPPKIEGSKGDKIPKPETKDDDIDVSNPLSFTASLAKGAWEHMQRQGE